MFDILLLLVLSFIYPGLYKLFICVYKLMQWRVGRVWGLVFKISYKKVNFGAHLYSLLVCCGLLWGLNYVGYTKFLEDNDCGMRSVDGKISSIIYRKGKVQPMLEVSNVGGIVDVFGLYMPYERGGMLDEKVNHKYIGKDVRVFWQYRPSYMAGGYVNQKSRVVCRIYLGERVFDLKDQGQVYYGFVELYRFAFLGVALCILLASLCLVFLSRKGKG